MATAEEQFAVVELMGHVRMVGRFEQVEMLGTKMGRLEKLKADGTFELPVYFGGQSVYRLSIITEEQARSETAERKLLPRPSIMEDGHDVSWGGDDPERLDRHEEDLESQHYREMDDEDDEQDWDDDEDEDPYLPEVQAALDEERSQGVSVADPDAPRLTEGGEPW